MSPFWVEAATEQDIEALLIVERECFSHPWTARGFREALDPARGRSLILRAPHEPTDPVRGILGYCVFELVVDEMHIHNLAVRPPHRGKGLGRFLLRLGLELGARGGAREVYLEVRQSNWAALQLYRSFGFETVSLRRDYYDRPREDALVLRRAALTEERNP
jgi:ribosomal-protein-alanine N-acetyltransferase